jgi:hypothetical protein
MSRDSICDFVLSITTSNVAWWDKNEKTTLQEGVIGCIMLDVVKDRGRP